MIRPGSVALTEARIRDMAAPDNGRIRVRDASLPGLALRISATGKKWYWRQRTNGRLVEVQIGSWPSMSVEAARKKARAELVSDPVAAVKAKRVVRTTPTLSEEWDALLANPCRRSGAPMRPSTLRIYKQAWPHLHHLKGRKVDEITAEDAIALRRRLEPKHGAHTTRAAMILLGRLLPNSLPRDPRHGPVARPKIQARRRFLDASELRGLLRGLDAEPHLWRVFWMCAIMAPLRRGNLASSKWVDLDLAEGRARWSVAAEDAKGGRRLDMPIVEPLARMLRDWRTVNKSVWVFPKGITTGDEDAKGPIVAVQHSWTRALTYGTAARFCEALADKDGAKFRDYFDMFQADVDRLRDEVMGWRGRKSNRKQGVKGKPLDQALALWAKKLWAAGIDPEPLRIVNCKPHDMRRTAGSLAVQAGISLSIVSASLGHSDLRVTQEHYAHMADAPVRGMLEGNAERILGYRDDKML